MTILNLISLKINSLILINTSNVLRIPIPVTRHLYIETAPRRHFTGDNIWRAPQVSFNGILFLLVKQYHSCCSELCVKIGHCSTSIWRHIISDTNYTADPPPWASCRERKLAGCACGGNVFPPPRVSDPDMPMGPCMTHVPWCMLGSLTSGYLWSLWRGKRSRHSRHMCNPQFTYLVRGPWTHHPRTYNLSKTHTGSSPIVVKQPRNDMVATLH